MAKYPDDAMELLCVVLNAWVWIESMEPPKKIGIRETYALCIDVKSDQNAYREEIVKEGKEPPGDIDSDCQGKEHSTARRCFMRCILQSPRAL